MEVEEEEEENEEALEIQRIQQLELQNKCGKFLTKPNLNIEGKRTRITGKTTD